MRGNEKKPRDAVAWKRLEVVDARLDVAARKLTIGQLALHDPQVVVERLQDGSINAAKWMNIASGASANASGPARPGAEAVAAAATSAPWQVALAQVSVDGGQVSWRDEAAPGRPPIQCSSMSMRCAPPSTT